MLNLIKMNISRLFRTKALYTTMIIVFGLFFLLAKIAGGEGTIAEFVGGTTGSGLVFMLVGIFATVYSDEERKSGFLKNLGAAKNRKRCIFLSKIPAISLYIAIMLATAVVAIMLVGMESGMMFGNISYFAVYFLFEILVGTAFGTAFLALYEIARGNVLPIIFAIITSAGIQAIIIKFAESEIGNKIPALAAIMERHIISSNLIVTKASQISAVAPFDYIPVLIVSLVGIAFYTVLGMTIFEKRDMF